MNRTLNLNTAKRPTFELTLMDENETTLHVKVPSLALFKELQAMSDDLNALDDSDTSALDAVYDLLARLLSCNRENLTLSGAELTNKYNVDFESALLVISEYVSFLTDIVNAKN